VSLSLSLIVDVKLSANRNARIRIAEGDDPAELASRFAKIYSLDKDATHILETVLRQSMIQRGILGDPRKEVKEQEESRGGNKHRHRHGHRSRSGSQSRRHSYDSYDQNGGVADEQHRRKHHHHRPHHRHSHRRKSESRDSFITLDDHDFGAPRDGDDLQPITVDDPQQFFEGNHEENIVGGGEGGGGRNSGRNSGRNTPSNLNHGGYPRFHRIDTDHSEMLGDTSVVVVDEEYSSYTESGSSRSGSDGEGEEGSYYDEDEEQYSESSSDGKQGSYQNPFSRSYRHDANDNNDQIANFLQKQGSARSTQRDRSSILSELL
jgi:hypothetical protein